MKDHIPFQTCAKGDDRICSEWFGDLALAKDHCCWKYEILDIPASVETPKIKEKQNKYIKELHSAGLAYKKGKSSHLCINGWLTQYPKSKIPEDYTWTDPDTQIKIRAFCDSASRVMAGLVAAAAAALVSTY